MAIGPSIEVTASSWPSAFAKAQLPKVADKPSDSDPYTVEAIYPSTRELVMVLAPYPSKSP